MLGSIPELPAETCKEIKASEGGQAVSGKYWFDSIIPGETVLAHCDMEKEGKLRGKVSGSKPKILDIARFIMLENEKGKRNVGQEDHHCCGRKEI